MLNLLQNSTPSRQQPIRPAMHHQISRNLSVGPKRTNFTTVGSKKQLRVLSTICLGFGLSLAVLISTAQAAETFEPYRADEIPQTVTDLWKEYDARKEPLDVQVVKEWKADGVVTRYVTFKVGTFKVADARIAAYYSFPDNGQKNAAFVWSHGGGQRAERGRGIYFAKQGFATVDINWLGRPMEDGIEVNTDWGNVDPTQGPRFYPKALRQGWKRNLQPDEYTIDAVPSPRNANWFLLAVAARRAITFLEQQPEVDRNESVSLGSQWVA